MHLFYIFGSKVDKKLAKGQMFVLSLQSRWNSALITVTLSVSFVCKQSGPCRVEVGFLCRLFARGKNPSRFQIAGFQCDFYA